MLRYRMHSKPRRWGWVVVILLIALLLILISSKGAQNPGALPVSSQNGGLDTVFLQFWSNLKAGTAALWGGLTGQSGPRLMQIDLGDQGAGIDAGGTDPGGIQIVKTDLQASNTTVVGTTPQILIYQTHSYESYDKQPGQDYAETAQWRTKDNNFNVAAVGEALAQQLTNKYGISVLHDDTDNECSQLGTAYTRSLKTAENDLANHPGLQILIDLHRDADNAGINPKTVTIDGKKVARIMFVIGNGQGETGVGFSVKPNWQANIKLAQSISNALGQFDPNLSRGVDVKTGRYNQHLSTGAVLIEVGENENTLQEALNAVPYLAQAIADVYNNMYAPGPSASAAPAVTASASPAATPSPLTSVTPQPTITPLPTGTAPSMRIVTIEPDETEQPGTLHGE